MTLSTANKIALAIKIAGGAGFGALILNSPAGAILGGIFAYLFVICNPVSCKTLRESVRVNWRTLCFLGGLIGMVVLRYAFHFAEAETVLRATSAGFVGVLIGEMFGGLVIACAKKPDSSNDKKD